MHAAVIRLKKPRPGTLLGPGQVARLGGLITEQAIDVAVIDGALSPVQQRNLERTWGCKVIDRTALILEIFADRARTREGRMQVELAALTYQRSRLVRSWTHLERQRGGLGFVGGPGETQIEADRRQIGERIARLRRSLASVTRTRAIHRAARAKVPYPVVALVGYTNAGKSTLFNRLTGATVTARNRLFETLDPTMRAIDLPSGAMVILSDTVGFVSELPHDLVAAFRATLEEVVAADLIVHVRDIAHAETRAQREDVLRVLDELGIGDRLEGSVIEVLNKLDRLPPAERAQFQTGRADADARWVATSALTGEGLDDLVAAIDAHFQRQRPVLDVRVPVSDGATVAWLYAHGDVIERHDADEAVFLRVRLSGADAGRLDRRGVDFSLAEGAASARATAGGRKSG